ncbi:hypothetical protein FJT64_026442 [Amphibalanus amphitrite]|uniref:Uncharacterized protein n=1 Tax=Amphibalanus amphitrite TaxID=1232801 RepID=A0A6A4W1V5_AMPAM|nr:hypothetical protein FJT64_026442 [Amphibalanus amphitrite]
MEQADGAPAPAAAPAAPVWPCAPRRGPPRPQGAPAAGTGRGSGAGYVMPASDVRLDDPGSAPDFSEQWSADLAAAMQKANENRAAAAAAGGGSETKPKGKKGRKGKSILISGGLSF